MDPRQPIAPLYTHSSTHYDDITTISSHPAVPSPLINDDLTLSHDHEHRLQQGDSEGPGKDEVVNEYVVKGGVKTISGG